MIDDSKLLGMAKHIQLECHKTVEVIINDQKAKVDVQDATNVFIFRKLAEYELRIEQLESNHIIFK